MTVVHFMPITATRIERMDSTMDDSISPRVPCMFAGDTQRICWSEQLSCLVTTARSNSVVTEGFSLSKHRGSHFQHAQQQSSTCANFCLSTILFICVWLLQFVIFSGHQSALTFLVMAWMIHLETSEWETLCVTLSITWQFPSHRGSFSEMGKWFRCWIWSR